MYDIYMGCILLKLVSFLSICISMLKKVIDYELEV